MFANIHVASGLTKTTKDWKRPMETMWITVGATTDSPEEVEVEVRNRDISDEAMDASWARIR